MITGTYGYYYADRPPYIGGYGAPYYGYEQRMGSTSPYSAYGSSRGTYPYYMMRMDLVYTYVFEFCLEPYVYY
jgi:hypothetical protein